MLLKQNKKATIYEAEAVKGSTSFRKYKHKNLQARSQYASTTDNHFIIQSRFKPAIILQNKVC